MSEITAGLDRDQCQAACRDYPSADKSGCVAGQGFAPGVGPNLHSRWTFDSGRFFWRNVFEESVKKWVGPVLGARFGEIRGKEPSI